MTSEELKREVDFIVLEIISEKMLEKGLLEKKEVTKLKKMCLEEIKPIVSSLKY